VLSYVNLMLSGYVPEGEMDTTLIRVQERLQELLDMIADILKLAQLKQTSLSQVDGLVAPGAELQDVATILEDVFGLLKEQAAQKQLDFELDILDRPVVMGSREHLKQVWMNLISNAIKYTPEHGRIVVSLRADEESVIGVVEDSGIGISEDDLPNLFQDFFRTDEAKTSGELGTGLGLSIVKEIVDGYHGQTEVASVLGQGSRFTIVLPLKPPPESFSGNDDLGSISPESDASHLPTRPTAHPSSFVLGADASVDGGT
jgi:two-component system phosphate regulon sensor histidine kinase PhoR